MSEVAPVVALTAPGEMGAAIGAVLVAHGLQVRCNFQQRSAASASRAQRAGLTAASDEEIAGADIILSIVAPENALAVARHIVQIVRDVGTSPVLVDCNPLSPRAMGDMSQLTVGSKISFVDGGIVGLPPNPSRPGPRVYVSGSHASSVIPLQRYGLDVRPIDGPIGAASALKLSYAGISKGLIAISSAMFLAAHRAGVDHVLAEEMQHSQSQLLASLSKSIPDMLGKAARWTTEMKEIADFIGDPRAERGVYLGAAGLYERLAKSADADAATLQHRFGDRDG